MDDAPRHLSYADAVAADLLPEGVCVVHLEGARQQIVDGGGAGEDAAVPIELRGEGGHQRVIVRLGC